MYARCLLYQLKAGLELKNFHVKATKPAEACSIPDSIIIYSPCLEVAGKIHRLIQKPRALRRK